MMLKGEGVVMKNMQRQKAIDVSDLSIARATVKERAGSKSTLSTYVDPAIVAWLKENFSLYGSHSVSAFASQIVEEYVKKQIVQDHLYGK